MSCQALQWWPELIWLLDGQPRQLRQVLTGAAASWVITPMAHAHIVLHGDTRMWLPRVVAGLSVPPVLGPNKSSAKWPYLRCLYIENLLSGGGALHS